MIKLFVLLTIVLSSLNVQGQSSNYKATIKSIKSLIKEHYVVEKKIPVLNDSLGLKNYDAMNPQEFAGAINAELQRFSGDKHLRLEYNPQYTRDTKSGVDTNDVQRTKEQNSNFGFTKLEILEGNIGLLRLSYFADPSGLEELVRSVFTFLENTDCLIIDLRANTGGSGSMLQRLMSIFIEERSASVLQVKYKQNTVQLKTDTNTISSYRNPVYLLCDQHTFSAGEGFVMILQNRKRATVIGETTAGAGNISGPYVVNDDFIITIPVGLIADVLTDKGWEGQGVSPDIRVPGSEALDKALQIIKSKP